MNNRIEICTSCHVMPALYQGYCWRCNAVLCPVRGVEPGDSHDAAGGRKDDNDTHRRNSAVTQDTDTAR